MKCECWGMIAGGLLGAGLAGVALMLTPKPVLAADTSYRVFTLGPETDLSAASRLIKTTDRDQVLSMADACFNGSACDKTCGTEAVRLQDKTNLVANVVAVDGPDTEHGVPVAFVTCPGGCAGADQASMPDAGYRGTAVSLGGCDVALNQGTGSFEYMSTAQTQDATCSTASCYHVSMYRWNGN